MLQGHALGTPVTYGGWGLPYFLKYLGSSKVQETSFPRALLSLANNKRVANKTKQTNKQEKPQRPDYVCMPQVHPGPACRSTIAKQQLFLFCLVNGDESEEHPLFLYH